MEVRAQPSRFGNDPTVVFWDLDGPINFMGLIIEALGNQEKMEKLKKEGFLYEVFTDTGNLDTILSVYISNLALLKATLSILDQNNIMSVMASQRITYGYREKFVVKVLEAIRDNTSLNDEDIQSLPKKEDGQVDFVALENALNMALGDTYNSLLPILLDYLKGNKDAGNALSEINTKKQFDDVLADFKSRVEKENKLIETLYTAIDEAIPNRGYLLREPAEKLGQAIAMRGLQTEADKSCYVSLAKAYLPECENISKAVLVDDTEKYAYTFVGTFVHANKTRKAIEPNLYFAQVLLKTIPLNKLVKSLEGLEDKASANELRKLIVYEFFSKEKKFDNEFIQFFQQKDRTPLYQNLLGLVHVYASNVKQQNNLTPDEKKAEFKKFILMIIEKGLDRHTIEEAVMIADLIKELESPFYNDLLRLETGFHGKAKKAISTLAGRSENPYGLTNTWSTVLMAAKQKAENIIASKTQSAKITITEEQDKNLSLLFAHQTERIAFFKPSNLRNYQELKQDKKLVVEVQRPIIHPVNHG